MADSPPSDYEGRPYHEKKFHKTHFPVSVKVRSEKDSDYVWIRIGVGRYRLVKKDKYDKERNERYLRDEIESGDLYWSITDLETITREIEQRGLEAEHGNSQSN